MNHDLPQFGYAHAVHSRKTTTSVLFNNCRLTDGNLIQFYNKQFKLVVGGLDLRENTKTIGNCGFLRSQSQRFFANASLNFSNSNCRCITFDHVAVFLSFMQLLM